MMRNEFIINAFTSVCNTKSYADCTKRLSPTTMETTVTRSPRLSQMRKLHSLIRPSKSNQNFQHFTHRLDFQNRKERPNDVGDLPKWLVEQIHYRPHPKFISIWLVVICCPEGEMKAGWLPWHRLDQDGPRQKGLDACTLSANYVPSTSQRLEYKQRHLYVGLSKFLH